MSGLEVGRDERAVCTGCPLVCDDILLADVVATPATQTAVDRPSACEQACERGMKWLAEALRHDDACEASVDAQPAGRDTAIATAALRLNDCRRVLVTGCWDATLETVAAAATLAECLGAAWDPAAAQSAIATGPTATQTGRITADFEELRDRADCVLVWSADPAGTHPRFRERFLTPLASGRERRVFELHGALERLSGQGTVEIELPEGQAAEAAVCLQLLLQEQFGPSRPAVSSSVRSSSELFTAMAEVAAACLEAECIGVVTADSSGESSGVAAAAISQLVAWLAHKKPAFEVPLSSGGSGAGPSGAAAVSTWRFGGAGAVAVADREGRRLAAAEADANRLLSRGEVDGVVVVGRVPDTIAASLAAFDGLKVSVSDQPPPSVAPQIWLNAAPTSLASDGQVLRDDGRLVELKAVRAIATPSAAELLNRILAELRAKETR